MSALVTMDAAAVRARLSIPDTIPIMREAMIALSSGQVAQHLRSFLPVAEGGTFAIMPAVTPEGFGAKLVSVTTDNEGQRRHQGVVVLFDPQDGAPVFIGDAEEITRIRTAAASAVATEALARKAASVLTVLGTGLQARAHICAMMAVRPIREVRLWGRSRDKAEALAALIKLSHPVTVSVHDTVASACAGADIICTVTAARDPVLDAAHVPAGCHVNLVGSSGPSTAEATPALVHRALFIGDHREHVLAHGGEFIRARQAGLILDSHFAAEIGTVLAGHHAGRSDAAQITLYKSLGHAVQDLAAAACLYSRNAGETKGRAV